MDCIETFTKQEKEIKYGKKILTKEIEIRNRTYNFNPETDMEKPTEYSGFGRGTVYLHSTRVHKPKSSKKTLVPILHKKDGRVFEGNKEITPKKETPAKKVMIADLIAKYKKEGHF